MSDRLVYMDNNATTPLHPQVKAVLTEALETFGNASSMHAPGRRARQQIEAARAAIAGYIGAAPEELIFVGSGSEANNTVLNIFSFTCAHCNACTTGRREVITSRIEHPCIIETSRCLVERGVPVSYINVDARGRLDLDELMDRLNDNTGLVSIMMANNEIGTLQDVRTIARLAHEAGALVHTDAVQALGKVPFTVDELEVDFLSLSGHKVYGPKGVGVLYVRKGTPFCALIRGGHQEKGRRAGTENTLGILGFGEAVRCLEAEAAEMIPRIRRLRDRLAAGIAAAVPDIRVNGHPEHAVPNTLNVSFAGAEGESILLYLDMEGIAVSTGSACSSGSLDPSHVLLATGLEAEEAHGSIRFSLGRENTEADVDYVLAKLPPVIARIRDMSTAYERKPA